MDPALVRILQAAADNPDYQSIANYLTSRRAYPELRFAPMSGKYATFTTPGLFSSGNIPERGVISINERAKRWDPQGVAPTMTHELTHAAEEQLVKQYYELNKKTDKTDLEKQFLENFQKIIGSSKPEISNWIKQVAPSFAKDEGEYRAAGNEALAFGMERSAHPDNQESFNVPQHLNPTIATTLMLLLDQAQRIQNLQQPKGR